jgi:CRP/FNR family transcriptional regulator
VFVLCAGEVKLSISSSAGKTLILRIAKPGEILGLMAVLANTPYEASAETLHPCQVAFVRRDDFLRLLAKYSEMHQGVVKQLTRLYSGACEQLRTVGLSASAPERVARLLLDWSAEGKQTKTGTQIRVPLTHQEIAEFVGTTRETVTRTLSEFKNKHLVELQGSTLTISNRSALECIGGI